MPTYGVNVLPSSIPPWAVNQRIGTAAGRYALNSTLMPRTDSGLTYTDYRSGVMASGDGGATHLAMQVNPAGGMVVSVNQGNAVINTQNQGAYMCCLDQQKNLTIPSSSGSTSRIDLVIARVYDDNNSALSGDIGIRQFTVEIVQGDAASRNPNPPEPPVGAIPLAYVTVPQGLNVITAQNVMDQRGPGLVTRGGMRALYGEDAEPGSTEYERPGAYPGDQRWVHSNHFQHQVYYGESDDPHKGGWRGVHNALVYNKVPTGPGVGVWIRGAGATAELGRLTVPYPGTPFMLYPTARVMATVSKQSAIDMRITLNDVNGPLVSWDRVDSGNAGVAANITADTLQGFNVAPIMWGPFFGDQVVVLSGKVFNATIGSSGFALRGNEMTDSLLSVVVYPSTVEPPS